MAHANLIPGMHCLCYHPQHAWVPGVLDSFDGKHGTVSTTSPVKEQISKLQPDDIFLCDEKAMEEDINDLLNLSVLHDGTLLNCLRIRYFRDVVYTNIGAIVVALNPFNFKIPWYMDDKMPDYLAEGETIQRNLPHSWAVAHTTYYEMMRDIGNQCILVSGESGAGKTEASKIVMKYLAAVSALQCDEEEKKAGAFVGLRMMQSNPILEAFGNAKTVRNDNSSRFGKLMRIKFNSKGLLTGADITKYLLEKSRIISSALNERIYHAFFLVLKGRDRERFGLQPLSKYRSVMSGKAPDIDGVDDSFEYDEVNNAMETCGMSKEESDSIWRCVGAVLSLLNLDFIASSADTSEIDPATDQYLTEACRMLAISEDELRKELTTTTLQLREGPVVTTLTKAKALDARDSFCKAMYDNLFGYLVKAINKTIDTDNCASWIALLDIFGFEDFKVNSFEQLCINLTNETLQRHYNYFIFTRDMEECREEGIDVTEITFPDNTPCVDMISGKGGILAVLDEDCLLAKATDNSFLDKISDKFAGKTSFFERPRVSKTPCFRVVHYAGTVAYEVQGFIEKNRDTLKDSFKLMVNASKDNLIKCLLPKPDPDNKSRFTVGGFFRSQLKDLMELIQSTNPHWIRCIKPHPAKKPLHFDGVQTLTQLRSSGVLGTVQIRKAGYPIRIPIKDFARKYKVILRSDQLDFHDAKTVAMGVLKSLHFDNRKAQMGKTRVFLKSEAYQQLEVVKKEKLQVFAKTVICGALVSLARFRTAALLRSRSASVIQAFLLDRQSQHVHREKDYSNRKEKIIADVLALLQLQQREAAARASMLTERDAFYDTLTAKRNRLVEDLYDEWVAAKPARDAAALASLAAAELTARAALEAAHADSLRAQLADLARDRAAAEAGARRAAAAAAAARREAQRRRALALWEAQKAAAEALVARRAAAVSRGRAGAQRAAAGQRGSIELRRQEGVLQARERAQYPTPQFRAAGVDALRDPVVGRGGLRGRIDSPSHAAYGGGGGGGYSGECIATFADPERERARVVRERVDSDKHSSLEIVRRLRALQTLRDATVVSGIGDPTDPRNPNWVPPKDGIMALPDGSTRSLDESNGLHSSGWFQQNAPYSLTNLDR